MVYNFAFFTIGMSILDLEIEELKDDDITDLAAGAELSTIKLLAEEIATDFNANFVDNVILQSVASAFEKNVNDVTELFREIQNSLGANAEAELRKKAIKKIQSMPKLITFTNKRPSNTELGWYWDDVSKERTKYQGFTELTLNIALILAESDRDIKAAEKLRKLTNGKYIVKIVKGRTYRIYIRFFFEEREERIEGLNMDDADKFRNIGVNKLSAYIDEVSNDIKKNKLTLKTENLRFTRPQKLVYVVTGGFKGVIPLLTLQSQLRNCEIKYKYERTDTLITIPALPIGFNIENEMEFAYWFGHKEAIKGDVLKRMKECGLIEIVNGVVELSAFGELMRKDISVNLAADGTHIGKMIELKIFRELSFSMKLIQDFCKTSDRIVSWKAEHGVTFNKEHERIGYDTDNKVHKSDIDVLVVFTTVNKRKTILAIESKMDSVFVDGRLDDIMKQSKRHLDFLYEEAKRQSEDNYSVDIVYALTIATAAIKSDYLKDAANTWSNVVKENVMEHNGVTLQLKAYAIDLTKGGKVNYSSFMDSKIQLQPI